MFTISKQFTFDAAHSLPHLPENHKCHRLHGHTYTVIVELACKELNRFDFVVDYGELDALKQYIDNELDHRNLNEVLGFPTTAENIAEHLYTFCASKWWMTTAVTVKETPNTSARYSP